MDMREAGLESSIAHLDERRILSYHFLKSPRDFEGREIRTHNLLIWSQTRYRCAISPHGRGRTCSVLSGKTTDVCAVDYLLADVLNSQGRILMKNAQCLIVLRLLIWSQTRYRCAISPHG